MRNKKDIKMEVCSTGFLVIDGVIKELTYNGEWNKDDGGHIIFHYVYEGVYPISSYDELIPTKEECRAKAIAKLG